MSKTPKTGTKKSAAKKAPSKKVATPKTSVAQTSDILERLQAKAPELLAQVAKGSLTLETFLQSDTVAEMRDLIQSFSPAKQAEARQELTDSFMQFFYAVFPIKEFEPAPYVTLDGTGSFNTEDFLRTPSIGGVPLPGSRAHCSGCFGPCQGFPADTSPVEQMDKFEAMMLSLLPQIVPIFSNYFAGHETDALHTLAESYKLLKDSGAGKDVLHAIEKEIVELCAARVEQRAESKKRTEQLQKEIDEAKLKEQLHKARVGDVQVESVPAHGATRTEGPVTGAPVTSALT